VRDWCTVAALAEAHKVINKPKAKKERIVIPPMKMFATIVRPMRDAVCELSDTSYFRDDFCRQCVAFFVVRSAADATSEISSDRDRDNYVAGNEIPFAVVNPGART
jgi:hypothetical protein